MPVMKKLMAQTAFKPVGAAIASMITVSVVTAIKPAHAFSITSDFTVQITSDAYANQGVRSGDLAYGSLTYDNANLTGIGSEVLSGAKGNLTLQFNFLNKLYNEQNDLNYGVTSYLYDYPIAFFTNGNLLGLDFLVVPSPFQPPQAEIGFRIFKDVFYVGATSNYASGTPSGTITYGVIPPPPPPEPAPAPGTPVAAVPEPSAMGGAIVACSFWGLWALRKVRGAGG